MHPLIPVAFILLTSGSYALLLLEIKKAARASSQSKFANWLLAGVVVWAGFVTFWSLTGRMGNFAIFPLNMMPVLAIPLIAILAFTFSKAGAAILTCIPPEKIIRIQAFRFFVELLLWALFLENLAPVQMTFEGRNWDILSGITAPLIALLTTNNKISKTGLILWNLFCLGLLVNILSIAILSMPTPVRVFMNEPNNIIVTQFPVSWLPGLLVPLAYGLHFISLRQLYLKK